MLQTVVPRKNRLKNKFNGRDRIIVFRPSELAIGLTFLPELQHVNTFDRSIERGR